MRFIACFTAIFILTLAQSCATEYYPISDFRRTSSRWNDLWNGPYLNNSDLSYLDAKLDTGSDIDDRGFRKKRDQASEEYNYSKAYDQFLAENFGIFNSGSSGSSKESAEDEKENKSCKTYFEDGKECTVCKDPETNARAEKCSYSSSPKEQKYAYKREKSYDSDDGRKQRNGFKIGLKPEQGNARENSAKLLAGKNNRHNPVKSKSKIKSHKDIPQDTGLPRFKFFDKVVKDFKTNDWSKCRMKHKNGAICYYCTNKDGIKNQECIYSPHTDHNEESEESPDNVTQKAKVQSEKSARTHQLDSKPAEKLVFKRTISMQIHTTDDDSAEIAKPFLYGKSIVHVVK